MAEFKAERELEIFHPWATSTCKSRTIFLCLAGVISRFCSPALILSQISIYLSFITLMVQRRTLDTLPGTMPWWLRGWLVKSFTRHASHPSCQKCFQHKHLPCDWEVVGSITGRITPKTIKNVKRRVLVPLYLAFRIRPRIWQVGSPNSSPLPQGTQSNAENTFHMPSTRQWMWAAFQAALKSKKKTKKHDDEINLLGCSLYFIYPCCKTET